MNMNDTVRIVCENTGRSLFVNRGTSLLQIAEILSLGEREDRPFLAAYVNNRLKELDFAVYSPVSIRYVDITHFEGMRVYQRTLFFVLQKAVYDLFPERKLHIKHSVAKGFYCEIEGMEDLSDEQIVRIKERMRAIVAQDLPIVRQKVTSAEAEAMYEALGLDDKIALLRTRPHLYVTVYSMADLVGYFYGALAVSTGYVSRFDLHPYYKGFRMALPQRTDPTKLEELVPQDKMFEVFSEYTRWVDVIGVANIGSLNARILEGGGSDLIRIAEALHEKALGNLADRIYERHRDGGARIVLISGPSSSGKTTFAKRLGIQLSILGMRPVLVSLDDYFVDREKTPLDEDGEYDYEALEAIDVGRFNDDLAALLAGREVGMPRYNFITGKSEPNHRTLRMDERSVLLIEGIHGLNSALSEEIPSELKYRVYVSALTQLNLDGHNRIRTTDVRLLRRMVRDARTRHTDVTATMAMWDSVRAGEEKYIFPYQEKADVMFNSSLLYEIAALKKYAYPMLKSIPQDSPYYTRSRRLVKFLNYFKDCGDESEIPPTSILREFIGGCTFYDE